MRIIGAVAISAVVLASAAADSRGGRTRQSGASREPAHQQGMQGMSMPMGAHGGCGPTGAAARPAQLATARYANDLGAAKADGYEILTQQIPGMGYHFINPAVKGFDVRKPRDPRLRAARRPLAARRARVGLPQEAGDATAEGRHVRLVPGGVPLQRRHVRARAERGRLRDRRAPSRARRSTSGTRRSSTMHVWIWYPNPAGMYASMNPLVHAFS